MRSLASFGYVLLIGGTVLVPPSRGQVPVASAAGDDRVPVRFVHVDLEDGESGNRLAGMLRKRIENSDAMRSEGRSTLVVWLRTLTLPGVRDSGGATGESPGVAWAIVIDLEGQHVTDNIGFADSAGLASAAEGIAASLVEMARELAREKTIALHEP